MGGSVTPVHLPLLATGGEQTLLWESLRDGLFDVHVKELPPEYNFRANQPRHGVVLSSDVRLLHSRKWMDVKNLTAQAACGVFNHIKGPRLYQAKLGMFEPGSIKAV